MTYRNVTQLQCVQQITGWQRGTGCFIFTGLFLQKSPVISGFVAERDLQVTALYDSLPPCICDTTNLQDVTRLISDAVTCRSLSAKEPLSIGLSHTLIEQM